MSIKNLPMNTYLSSKISIQAAFISEIRLIKEEAIRLQLEAYRLELQEELRIAVEEFRVAQAALLEAAAEEPAQSDVPVEEPITEAEFIEKLEKLNEEKLEALNKELHNTLKKEMAELQLKRSSELILAYGSQFQLDRVASLYSDFFKEPAFIDSLLNSVLLQRNHSWYNLESFLNNLPKNAFVDPLVILFLLRINYSTLKTFEKFRKVKIRKFKMKRRKVRKLYVFRKLKKIVLFRKIKKKLFQVNSFNDQFELTSSRSSRNILVQRIPVSTRVIEAASVDFFYKLNKKKNRFLIDDFDATVNNEPDLLIYLRNYHQKPYHKLRKARIAHWGLFFNKTLRKQRYKGFINRFVKKPNKLSYVMNYFVNVFTKMKFSWTRVDKLESFFKLYFVEYSRNIVRIPMIFANFFKWKILKKRSLFLRKKMGRWSYLNFRRATCPWLQRKKNTPKINYHIQPNLFYFNSVSYWDVMTGFIFVEENIRTHCVPPYDQFKSNLLVKLHMYRYKANKKCMSH